MDGVLHIASLAALTMLLLAAAIGDLRSYTIPNRLTAAVAALSLPFWLSAGVDLWPLLAWQLLSAVIVFALLALLFVLGAMGGGDVKLLTALALWFTPLVFMQVLAIVAISGGLLTVVLLVRHRMRRAPGQPEIPYGVAIAAGALVGGIEPIVKQFAG